MKTTRFDLEPKKAEQSSTIILDREMTIRFPFEFFSMKILQLLEIIL